MRNPEHIKIMKENLKAVVGELKIAAMLYPNLQPVINKSTGKTIDINATWPSDIVEQYMTFRRLMFSTE